MVIPTIHRIVNGIDIKGLGIIFTEIPKQIAIIATTDCIISFTCGVTLKISSNKPNVKIINIHNKIPIVNLFMGMKMKYGITKAKNMPIPPNKAVGFLCHLSSLGFTINPYLFDILMIMGAKTNDNIKESTNGIAYLNIILCVPVIFNHAFYYPFNIYSWFVTN